MTWEQLYDHLRIKHRAKTTLHFYGTTQRSLSRYTAGAGGFPASPMLVTVGHLRGFLVWLEDQGLAPGGVHAHVRSLKSLLGWAHWEELLASHPSARLERPSLPRRRLPTMTPERVGELPQEARKTDQPLQDVAMVLTLFDTGIRLAELIDLRIKDLQPSAA